MSNQTPGLSPGAHARPSQADPRQPSGDLSAATFLKVVRGEPTDAELAALVSVLSAGVRAATAADSGLAAARAVRSSWADRSRSLREPIRAGSGAWRRSALPR
jgi:hypothetical protein